MKPSELFCCKETTTFATLFFLSDITRQFIWVKYFELSSIAGPKITLKMVNLTVLLHKEFETLSLQTIYLIYILYSTLRHKSYFTVPYVTSPQDSFCL